LYCLPNVIRMKSRRVRCAGHVGCMGVVRNAYKFFYQKTLTEQSILKDLVISWRILLKQIFQKKGGRVWTGSCSLEWRPEWALVNMVTNLHLCI
jgi:hypothetical protein